MMRIDWKKSKKRLVTTAGCLCLVAAFMLYLLILLYTSSFELLLTIGILVLVPLGLFLVAEKGLGVMPRNELIEVRLAGPGEEGTAAREKWVQAQLQRARSIRFAVLATLVAALALYVANHVTGDVAGREPLSWRTHAERLDAYLLYETRAGDTLAGVALVKRQSVEALATANPAAALTVPVPLKSAVNDRILPSHRCVTVEAIAKRYSIEPAQAGVEFAAAQLLPGQRLRVPELPDLADPIQWYDWFLWSLVGLTAYLLVEVARHSREIFGGGGDFLRETSWYWTQLATGPLVALVILLLFTKLGFALANEDAGAEAALAIDVGSVGPDLLIVPAFLLGFYSRVARELLDQLMRRVFGSAWRAANGDFEVAIQGHTPNDREVVGGSSVTFETKPPTAVMWGATAGQMNAGGVFTAPGADTGPQQVVITAIPATDPSRATAVPITIVKHKFKVAVMSGNAKVKPGDSLDFEIQPPPADADKVTWELVGSPTGVSLEEPSAGARVKLKVDPSASAGKVKVRATYAGVSKEREVEVVAPAAQAAAPTVPAPAPAS